ncbi:HIT domain-containing protein [Patescibacteria group bacterium]|nr:HIT domain-containing protein [Patescibacteria group bacterium]
MCVFCKIAKGEIPCHKIYEDEEFLAILDINPVVKGHTLVIPKKHVEWVWDMQNYPALMERVKTLALVLRKAFNTPWVAEGIAGIDVPHAHVHLLPRQVDDGLGAFPHKLQEPKPTDEDLKSMADKIKQNI